MGATKRFLDILSSLTEESRLVGILQRDLGLAREVNEAIIDAELPHHFAGVEFGCFPQLAPYSSCPMLERKLARSCWATGLRVLPGYLVFEAES